jgi:COMPASS component SPP1
MEGLEALVQAATQERKRLDGEESGDVVSQSPSQMAPWTSPMLSPVDAPLFRSPSTRRKTILPLMGPTREPAYSDVRSPYEPSSQLPSPHQLHRSLAKVLSPEALSTPMIASSRRSSSPQRSMQPLHAISEDLDDSQPAPKRRRSSEHSAGSRKATPLVEEIPSSLRPFSPTRDVMRLHLPSQPQVVALKPEVPDPSHSSTKHIPTSPVAPLEDVQMSDAEQPPSVPTHLLPVDSLLTLSSDVISRSQGVDIKAEALDTLVVPAPSSPVAGTNANMVAPQMKKQGLDRKAVNKSREKSGEKSAKAAPRDTDSQVDSGSSRKDDTDDWFLEQFGDSETRKLPEHSRDASSKSANSSSPQVPHLDEGHHRNKSASSSSEHRSRPITSKKQHSRSPTPVEMLEAELQDVPLVPNHYPSPQHPAALPISVSPHKVTRSSELDLDAELERTLEGEPEVRASKPKPKPRPKAKPKVEDATDMDVENELLALLDDEGDKEKERAKKEKHVLHHVPAQLSGTSVKRDSASNNVTPTLSTSTSSEQRGRTTNATRANKIDASETVLSVVDASSLMPPPDSRGTSQARGDSKEKVKEDSEMPTARVAVSTLTSTATSGAAGKDKGGSATLLKVRNILNLLMLY